MNKLTTGIVLLMLAGCGDTINQTAPGPAQNKLAINSVAFSIYSTPASTTTNFNPDGTVESVVVNSRNYWLNGDLEYSGDIEGCVLTVKEAFEAWQGGNSTRALLYLWPGNKATFNGQWGWSTPGSTLFFTLTDPHGNDSNTFPMVSKIIEKRGSDNGVE